MNNQEVGKPLEISSEWVCLCEGSADVNFLKKLIARKARIPPANFLDPARFHGRNDFGRMMNAMAGTGISFRKVKGIVIVADSHDDPSITFREVCKQLTAVPNCPVPEKIAMVSNRTDEFPPICILLLPDEETPGSLESLFVRAIVHENENLMGCVDTFLSCGDIDANAWPPEKKAKAQLHSIIAAFWKNEPNIAASQIFQRSQSLISISNTVFDRFESLLESFCAQVGIAL